MVSRVLVKPQPRRWRPDPGQVALVVIAVLQIAAAVARWAAMRANTWPFR